MTDIHTMITDRIIAELESGTIPWHKPWLGGTPAISHVTGKPYSLLNQMLLNGKGGEYLTFNQAKKAGGYVRKGEKAAIIVFWKWLQITDQDTGEEKEIPYLRYYNVFHIDQCDGIAPRYSEHRDSPSSSAAANDAAEAVIHGYIARSGVQLISRESSDAFYQPLSDTVVLPLLSQFTDTAEYYSTAFHELAHSTGHPKRLARLTEHISFGSDRYSQEELCAELSASFILNSLNLETSASFRNNAAYIANWLKVLKDDKKMIVSAAGKAEKAALMILGKEWINDDAEC